MFQCAEYHEITKDFLFLVFRSGSRANTANMNAPALVLH
jgi:hypothetical protein